MNEFEKKLYLHGQSIKKQITSPVNIESEDFFKMKKKIGTRFILAAAIIAILGTTTVLAATFNWHEKLIEYLNLTDKQMQDMIGAVNTPNATITKNGVTVTIKQTIADSQGLYVLYEVTVPEWMELDDDITWKSDYIDIEPEYETETGYSGSWGTDTLEQNQSKRTSLLHYGQTARIGKGNIGLKFEDLGYYNKDEEGLFTDFVTLVEGEWELRWELNYEDTSRTFETNEFVSINGSTNIVSKVVISPMSVYVCIKGDDVLMSAYTTVNFKDGTGISFDFRSDNHSFIYSARTGNDLYYRFNNVINPDDVESITVGDVTIPLDGRR